MKFIKRNKLIVKIFEKLPCKVWLNKKIRAKYQKKLDLILTTSMEEFNYLKFKLALILGANPNVDAKIKVGYHLVTRCARSGEPTFLDTLLKFGGDINGGEGIGGYLPIHMASTKGNSKSIEILVNHGADFNAVFDVKNQLINGIKENQLIGWTPLICACKANKKDCIEILLKMGANPLIKDENNLDLITICGNNKELITYLKNNIYFKKFHISIK